MGINAQKALLQYLHKWKLFVLDSFVIAQTFNKNILSYINLTICLIIV